MHCTGQGEGDARAGREWPGALVARRTRGLERPSLDTCTLGKRQAAIPNKAGDGAAEGKREHSEFLELNRRAKPFRGAWRSGVPNFSYRFPVCNIIH